MTRDDWRRVEPVLTEALLLPDTARKDFVETAALGAAVRRELMDLLRMSDRLSGRAAEATVGSARASAARAAVMALPLSPGETVDGGRFVIVRQIGRGGMGMVYLAQDTTLGTLVALKVVARDDRLLHEAQRAAACSGHEHVATVHNVLRTEAAGEPVGILVMEHVAGRPASRIVEDGPVAPARALRWAAQAAAAVAHAHDCEVLHCDIKPANIIVTPDDRVKVLDFGIARATFDPNTPAEPLEGTLPYMAPELLLAGEFSRASDVYSLGVTLFELLTGRLPFGGDDLMLRLEIVAAPAPKVSELVPGVPAGVDALIERALAKHPEQRFRSARAFARAIEELDGAASKTNRGGRDTESRYLLASTWANGLGMVAGGAAIALVFGLLACRAFEVILRVDSEFAASPGTYFRIGVAALVPLIALSVLTAAILGGLAVIALLVRRPARRVWSAWSGLQQRMNPQTVAAAVLVVGTALWLTLTWTYRELFGAMLDLYQHPATASVGAISGASRGAHVQYANASASLSFLLIVAALVWLPRLARRAAEPANIRTLSWGVLALAFVVMLGPTVPRRFLFERFRVMEYAGRPMPEIGRSGTDLLLFDRTRRVTLRVRHDASVLTPTERTELLFGD